MKGQSCFTHTRNHEYGLYFDDLERATEVPGESSEHESTAAKLRSGKSAQLCHRPQRFWSLQPFKRNMKRVLPMFTCFLPLAFGHKRRNSRSSSNGSAPQPHPLGGVPRSLPCLCAPEPSAQLAGSDSAAQLAELYGDGGPASAPASQDVPADTEPVSAERRSPSEAPASEGNSSSYKNPLVSEELVRCPSRPSPRSTPLSRRSRRTMRRLRSLVPRSARLRSGGGDSDSSTSSGFGVSGRTCVDDSRRVGSQAATHRSRSRTPRSNADDSRPLLDGSVTDSSDDSSFDDVPSDADEDDEDAEICILDTLDSQKPGRLRPRRSRTRPKTPSIPIGDRPTSGSAAATVGIDLDITPPTSQSNALYSKDRSVELDLGTAAADAAALLGDVTGGAGSPVLPQVPPAFGTALHPLEPNESLSAPSSTEDSLLRLSLNVSSSSATGSHSSYAASPLQPSAAHPTPLVPNQLATDSASAAHAPTRPYGRSAYPAKAIPGIWAPLHRGVGRGGAGMPLAVPRQGLVGSPPYPPSSTGGHHMYRRMSPGGMPQLQLMQWQHHMSGAEASVVSSASNTSSPITTPRSSMSHPQHLASFGSWLHPAGSIMSPSLITDTPDVSARYSINDSDVLRNNLTSGLSSHESATVMQTDSLALFMESAVLPMPTDAVDESAFDDTVNGATAAAAATSTDINKEHNATTFANSTFAASSAQSESMFAVGDAAHTRTGSDPLTSRSNKSTAEKLETLSFSNELVAATFGSAAVPSKTKGTLMVSVQPPVVVKRRPGTPEVSHGGTTPSAATVETSSALNRALSTGGASLNLFPAENQVGEVADLAPAGAKSPSVSLQPQSACRPLSTQSSGVLSQNSVDASIAVATGDDADTKHTGDEEFRIQSPPAPSLVSSTHATIDPALLATKLEDSESANLLETALAMASGKVSSPTAGTPAIPPSPHVAATHDGGLHVAMPQAKPWPQILPPSPYRNSASAKYGAGSPNAQTHAPIISQQSDESSVRCAACKHEEAAGGRKGRVSALPEDLCRGGGGLCDECSGKVVSEARARMFRGMHFLCPCSCGQRWAQSPMSRFASLASRTPLPVPLPPLAPSNSSVCEPPSESDASDDSCSLNSSPAEPPTTPMPRMLSFTSSPSRSPIATPLALPGVPELNPIAASTPSPPPSPPPYAPSASPESPSSAQALCSAAAAAAASVLQRSNSLHRNRSLGQLHLDLSFRLPTLDNPSCSNSLPTTPEREAASHPSPSCAALASDSHSSRGSNPSASRRLTHSRSHPNLSSPHGSTSSGEFPSAPLQPPAALLVGGGIPTPRFGPPAAATSAAPATAHSLTPPQHATPVEPSPEAVQTAPAASAQSPPMSMSPSPSPPPPSTRPPVHRHVHKMQAASKLATVRLPPRPRSIPSPPSSTTSTSVPPTHMRHASRSGSHIPHAPRSFMFQPSQDEAYQRGAARWEAAVDAVRGYSAPPRQPHRRPSNASASSSTIKQTRGQRQPRTGTHSEDSQPRRELHMPRTRHVFRAPARGSNRTSAAHTRSTSTGSAGRRNSSSIQETINTAQPPTMLDSLDGAPADGPVAESATCRTPRHFHTATTSKDVTRAATATARAAHHVALSCMPKEDLRTPPPRRSTERHLWHTNPVALPPTAPTFTPPTDHTATPPRSRSTRSLQKLLSLPASALQCVKGGPMSPGAGDALAAMTDFSLLNSTEHGYPEGPSVMSQGCAGKSSGVVSLDACSASMKRDQTDTLPLQALLAMEDSDSSMGAAGNPQRHYNNPKARVPANANPSRSCSRRSSGASTNSPTVRRSRTYTAPSEALLQSIVDECWAAATASGHLHHLVGRSSSTFSLGGGPCAADKDFLSQCAALEEALCRTSDSSRMSRSPSLSASRAMSGSLMRQSSRHSLRQSSMHGHSSGASASFAAVPSGASNSVRSSSHTRMRTR